MASPNLTRVIQRAISDAAFRRLLQSNPEAALRGFKLTSDEVAALRSGDSAKLISFGVDQRMSKVFVFGDGIGHPSAAVVGGSELSRGSSALVEEGARASGAVVIPSDPAQGAVVPDDRSGPAIDPGYVERTESATMTPVGRRLLDLEPQAQSGAVAPSADDIEDMGHAAAARAAEASQTTYTDTGRRLLDLEPQAQSGAVVSSSDAIEDASHEAAARAFDASQTTYTDTGRRLLDLEPQAQSGAVAPSSDAIEDARHEAAARAVDASQTTYTDTGRRLLDLEPQAQSGSGLAAPLEGTPEEYSFRDTGAAPSSDAIEDASHEAAARAADASQTTYTAAGRHMLDLEPQVQSGAEAAETTYTAAGRHMLDLDDQFASSDAVQATDATALRSVDAERALGETLPTLEGGTVSAASGDAFLTETEATSYAATDPNWSSDVAEDTAHAFNPDAPVDEVSRSEPSGNDV
jgi:hypothetical protein